jgi:hypothetical protein
MADDGANDSKLTIRDRSVIFGSAALERDGTKELLPRETEFWVGPGCAPGQRPTTPPRPARDIPGGSVEANHHAGAWGRAGVKG